MAPGVSESVRVIVRIRPLTRREIDRGDAPVVQQVSETSLQVADSASTRSGRAASALAYQFAGVLGPECSQDQVFQGSGVATLLDHILEGYSATAFAYGPTGSGKTYSVSGRPDSIIKNGSGDASDGLVMRAIESLFEKIRGLQREGLQFKVRASCVEIHNESVIDLVRFSRASKSCTPLPVKFDTASAAFFVHELSYCKCPTEEDLLRIYMRTLRNRSVAAHQLNRDSSRSHMLFTVYVDSMVKGADGHITTRHGKITFVDLAGSERLKESKSEGATLRETGAINKSLFTLGKVIASLCDRKRVRVPYRDSKLTQLLADSIGGTSLTLMLACVSPSDATLSETTRTLDYAIRAKDIRNKPVVLLDPQQNMVKELQREIEALRSENRALKDALLQIEGGAEILSASLPALPYSHRADSPAQPQRASTGVLPGGSGGVLGSSWGGASSSSASAIGRRSASASAPRFAQSPRALSPRGRRPPAPTAPRHQSAPRAAVTAAGGGSAPARSASATRSWITVRAGADRGMGAAGGRKVGVPERVERAPRARARPGSAGSRGPGRGASPGVGSARGGLLAAAYGGGSRGKREGGTMEWVSDAVEKRAREPPAPAYKTGSERSDWWLDAVGAADAPRVEADAAALTVPVPYPQELDGHVGSGGGASESAARLSSGLQELDALSKFSYFAEVGGSSSALRAAVRSPPAGAVGTGGAVGSSAGVDSSSSWQRELERMVSQVQVHGARGLAAAAPGSSLGSGRDTTARPPSSWRGGGASPGERPSSRGVAAHASIRHGVWETRIGGCRSNDVGDPGAALVADVGEQARPHTASSAGGIDGAAGAGAGASSRGSAGERSGVYSSGSFGETHARTGTEAHALAAGTGVRSLGSTAWLSGSSARAAPREQSPYARSLRLHTPPQITGLKYGASPRISPALPRHTSPSARTNTPPTSQLSARGSDPWGASQSRGVGATYAGSFATPSSSSLGSLRNGSKGRGREVAHVPPRPEWNDSAVLPPRERSATERRAASAGGGARHAPAALGDVASYDALMRDLEESRRKAEAARQHIMARQQQWESGRWR